MPIILLLDAHRDHVHDLAWQGPFETDPGIESSVFADVFGNEARRLVTPSGPLRVSRDSILQIDGLPQAAALGAQEMPIAELSADVLVYLYASRYCDIDLLDGVAWDLFGHTPNGWSRVQAVCDFVHAHVAFGYEHARATRTASETYRERVGVCRDFAHLAIAFCRCLNIPARYANGFLGDVGVPPDPAPMDYNAWFEAYLDDAWWIFDARHNVPRIGRITVARGRDATDVAMVTSFGPHRLDRFRVWTEEVEEPPPTGSAASLTSS